MIFTKISVRSVTLPGIGFEWGQEYRARSRSGAFFPCSGGLPGYRRHPASASLQVARGSRDADVDASETTATMSNVTGFVLGALVGAGTTCVGTAFNSHVPDPSRSDGTSTTISKATAAAWQVLRRPGPTEPVEPQAEIVTIRPRPPLSVQTVPPPLEGVSLTRALQRELKKIGCYQGDINGVWTSATRQAMKAFTHLANAKLPIDQPNHILLALVQSDLHQGYRERCREGRTNHNGRLEDAAATALPKTKAAASTRNSTSLLKPPMGLAGPKASEIGKGQRRSVAPDSPNRNADTEHWAVTLWKKTAN